MAPYDGKAIDLEEAGIFIVCKYFDTESYAWETASVNGVTGDITNDCFYDPAKLNRALSSLRARNVPIVSLNNARDVNAAIHSVRERAEAEEKRIMCASLERMVCNIDLRTKVVGYVSADYYLEGGMFSIAYVVLGNGEIIEDSSPKAEEPLDNIIERFPNATIIRGSAQHPHVFAASGVALRKAKVLAHQFSI